MLLTTILREAFTAERFARIAEHDTVTDSSDAVAAFARAAAPGGILSGVHAFFADQASRVIRPGDTVLDLGCGPAAHLMNLAARHPACLFTGVDASPGMIAAASVANRQRHVTLRVDDMTALSSVHTGSVDVVVSSMALHHLPDAAQLAQCLAAVERVLKADGHVFIMDFGRLRSLRSIQYFVRRAIPAHEPLLARDYKASLLAAFSRAEMDSALPLSLRRRVSVYATIVSPLMMVIATPMTPGVATLSARALPPQRRADYRQLALAFRLGGMPLR